MTLASTLGKYCGIVAAEALWLAEMGVKTGASYYVAKVSFDSYSKLSEIAQEHAIDSNNSESVCENLFNCLEYID